MYEHVNEDPREIEVEFVKTNENDADIFTKNVPKEIMERQTGYLGKEKDID